MNGMYFDARIDGDQLAKDIATINRHLAKITQSVKKEGDEIDGLSRRMGSSLAGAFSIFATGSFIKDIANVRGEFQQLEVAFETMLGSKDKADKLMAEVVAFASKTPFELKDVASGTKQLLAFGVQADNVIPTLKSLGDVSAGLSVPIDRLILNFGQVRTKTKLMGEELRDFQVSGVPIVAELAKNMGVAEDKISEMVSAGKIGFDDVEKAFRTMTEQGGRFNNLMDKQSKTITGLASNFADAWDKMLNSIGQQNEGVIANSITGAITVVENYEEVIKILKVLVATYGTYKAAVIATAVAQRSAGIVDSIRLIAMYRKEMGLATAAQQAFNTASKANPYGLILAGITGVITLLTVFGNQTKKTEDYIESLNDNIEAIGKQASVDQLVNDYVTLQQKTNKTEEEQKKLNTTISELAKIFPGAIKGTDEYGKAIDVSKEKVIELNEELRENQRILTEKNLEESQRKLNELVEKRQKLLNEINSGQKTVINPETGTEKTFELSEKELAKKRQSVAILSEEIVKLGGTVSKTQENLTSFGTIDKEKFKQQYAELFGDVTNMTKDQAEETKNSLEKLLQYQFGNEIAATIKSQIDVLNNHLALPTIQEQIKKTTEELKKAKTTLDAMRKPGSQSTPEKIESQESTVKDLEDTLAKLTGTTKKDAEKRAADEKERQEKALKSLSEFNERQLDLERSLQASRIALMKEGADRQQAEAELEYQLRIDQLKKQQQEYLEAYNAKQGFEPGDKGYVTKLPAEELAKFDQLRVDAEQQKNQKIVQINKEAADQVKAVWSEVSDAFKSDQQKEIDAVNKKYNEITEKTGAKVGSDEFIKIQEARGKEILEIIQKYGIQTLEFEQEMALKSLEIGESKFQTEVQRENKKAEILKKAAQEKINLLKANSDKESKEQIASLEKFIDEVDANLGQVISKNVAENISLAIDFTDQLVDKLKETAGLSEEQSDAIKSGLQAFQGLARIASGDVIGGAMQTVMAGIDLFIQAPEKLSEHYKNLEQQVNKVIESANIANRTLQYLGTVNPKLNLSIISSGLKQVAKDAKDLNKELEGKTSTHSARQGSTNIIVSEQYRKLNAEAADLKKEMELLATRLLSGDISDEQRTAIEATLNAYNDLIGQMDNLTNQLIGTNVNDLGKSIIEAFLAGEDAAEKWGDKVSEIIKKVVVDQLSASLLTKPIQAAVDALISDMENGLTPEEAKKFKDTVQSTITAAKPAVDAMDKAFSELGFTFKNSDVKQQGLTGAIQNITEETGGLIAGQFFAMRELNQKQYMTGLEQLDVMNQSMIHLANIEKNTSHNYRLKAIEEGITAMLKLQSEKL